MDEFSFHSSLIERPLTIVQEVKGIIGCKVYPGALLLVKHFERRIPPPLTRFLELGSGVCGLPSLVLSGAGFPVVATDVPVITEGLARNLVLNSSSALCLPLTWGNGADECALRAALLARGQQRSSSCPLHAGAGTCGSVVGLVDVIIAADCVYHEPLIEPLLASLVALTDPPLSSAHDRPAACESAACPSEALQCTCVAPIVVMSYVQVRLSSLAFVPTASYPGLFANVHSESSRPRPSLSWLVSGLIWRLSQWVLLWTMTSSLGVNGTQMQTKVP